MPGNLQNLIPDQPQLIDLLNLFKRDLLLGLNCHHVGTIVVFNPLDQTASVQINYTKTFYEFNEFTGIYDSTYKTYPILMDCPVIILGGGTAALTFPILPGDECLVLFNDRDFDNWFSGGTGAPCATARLHNFADAMVIVGLRSLPRVLTGYDSIRACLRNGVGGTTVVAVGPLLVKIANATTTLNTLLQTLVSDIQTLVVDVSALVAATASITVICAAPASPSSVPVNAAAIAAVAVQLAATTVQLTTTASQIALLLE